MSKFLSGKTIVITRPLHQAVFLAQQIQETGGESILFPTIEIEPLISSCSPPAGQPPFDKYDLAIFVSANAVRCAQVLLSSAWKLPCIAVGPGTAKALQEFHIQVNWIPTIHQSEGILDLPILQRIAGKKFLIFCGENSRPLLKKSLVQRGAAVDELICYRRTCPQVEGSSAISQWRQSGIHLIISTSLESLENLWHILGGINNDWLWGIPLLVINEAMQDYAKCLGFNTIYLAGGASDATILQTLNQIYTGVKT